MNAIIINRILLNVVSATLILLALAYWWLGNVAHELFGTGLFLLLARHIYMNRFWFSNLLRGRYDLRRTAATVLHLMLLANMIIILVTSIMISESLRAWFGVPNMFAFREMHWFAAYWSVMIVGAHVGMNWKRVAAVLSSRRAAWTRHRFAVYLAWPIAASVVAFGVWSYGVLGLGTKLTFGYSLEFWDFSTSVLPFFLHWLGVVALAAILSHTLMKLAQLRDRRTER